MFENFCVGSCVVRYLCMRVVLHCTGFRCCCVLVICPTNSLSSCIEGISVISFIRKSEKIGIELKNWFTWRFTLPHDDLSKWSMFVNGDSYLREKLIREKVLLIDWWFVLGWKNLCFTWLFVLERKVHIKIGDRRESFTYKFVIRT